jgi:DNA processing protein
MMTTLPAPYVLALALVPRLPAAGGRKLMEYFGSAEAVFRSSPQELMSIPGFRPEWVRGILDGTALERARKALLSLNQEHIHYFDLQLPGYPHRLRQCEDAPLAFFCKGTADLGASKVLSVVGTRSATEYGKSSCRRLISGLVALGHRPLIVSGLAYGIDITAHRMALECGLSTVAVLAHGLDQLYPAEHRREAAEIIRQGALLSEFIPGTPPLKPNFVQRNRIIAGLADATVVVESGLKGGSLSTAGMAVSYHRELLALPGRVSDPYSAGCLALIRSQKAQLFEQAADLAYYLGWESSLPSTAQVQGTLFEDLSPEECQVLEWIRKHERATIDLLCAGLLLPAAAVSHICSRWS